jgi:hypothetical protein
MAIELFVFINQGANPSPPKTKKQAQMSLDRKQWVGWTLCQLVPVRLDEETVTTTRKVIP